MRRRVILRISETLAALYYFFRQRTEMTQLPLFSIISRLPSSQIYFHHQLHRSLETAGIVNRFLLHLFNLIEFTFVEYIAFYCLTQPQLSLATAKVNRQPRAMQPCSRV